MRRARLVIGWGLLGLLASLGIVYLVDDLAVRYRTAGRTDEVTFYYATMLKNGRVEVFYDQPQTEACVHALFPHLGLSPCWYVARHTVRRIGLFTPGPLRGLT
jgi:hypothetical protein